MVAGEYAVGRACVVEEAEHLAHGGEFGGEPVLGDIAEVGQEDDVVVRPVLPVDPAVEHVADRGLDRRRVDPVLVEQVLGVRHDDEGEPAGVRVGLPTLLPGGLLGLSRYGGGCVGPSGRSGAGRVGGRRAEQAEPRRADPGAQQARPAQEPAAPGRGGPVPVEFGGARALAGVPGLVVVVHVRSRKWSGPRR